MNANVDYERYNGLGLAGLVKDRSVSAAELLEAAIERVEQRNPAINAVVDRMYDQTKAAIAAGSVLRRALPAQGYRAVICRRQGFCASRPSLKIMVSVAMWEPEPLVR